jgi:hypothetical protein
MILRRLATILALTLVLAGCDGSDDDGVSRPPAPDPPEAVLWESPEIEPPQASFIDRMPELADVSTWADTIDYHAAVRRTADMPYLGTGNGSVCCLVGTRRPLSTVHGLLGPTYQKGDLQFFFPDIIWTVEAQGRQVVIDEETIWRVRRSAVVITRARSSSLEIWSVIFAPFPDQWPGDPSPKEQTLFHLLYLVNLSPERQDNLTLRVRSAFGGDASGGSLVVVAEPRSLRVFPLGEEGQPSGRSLSLRLGLDPGQQRGVAFGLTTSSPAHPEGPALEALEGFTLDHAEEEVRKTVRAWRSWYGRGAHLETPDPRVTDLLEGLVVTDKVQTTIAGGPVEISHYSLVWNRDTYGPLLWFTATGREAEARGILDYHFTAVRYRGGLANAYDADLDPAAAPPPPSAEDWAAMGTFTGRTAAEGPSFLVLDYDRYLKLRGHLRDFDPADLTARLNMLRACVYQQGYNEEGLLPFSGDETFRPQMAISFGLGIEYPFEERAWSFNSGTLLVAAAEGLARIEMAAAEILGTDGAAEAQRALELAERIREATRTHFWNGEGGYFEPFLLRPSHQPAGAPYGDVNGVAYWVGVEFPDVDPEAAADVLARELLSPHGVFFSPADPLLQLFFNDTATTEIYTGMTPGYTLWCLTSAGHPNAQEAFNAMGDHASPGGTYPEVVVHHDTSPLTPIYDEIGITGEIWARYRSWEAGINGESTLYFLSGFLADATRNHILLAPRLPNSWPWYRITGLRVGEASLDLKVERLSRSTLQVSLVLRAQSSVTAGLRIPGPALLSAKLGGSPLEIGPRFGRLWGGTGTDLGEIVLVPGTNRLRIEFASEIP